MADSSYTRAMFGSLQAAEADYQAIYTQLLTTINDLDSKLQSELSQWDGSARAAYGVAKSQWDQAMANMQMVLKNLQGVASEASARYPAVEAQNATLWNG
jgi:WXG100 family type VII secretion target